MGSTHREVSFFWYSSQYLTSFPNKFLGGKTEEDNLWLACSLCNQHKNDQIAARDPLTGALELLFDPRHQVWSEHFAWTAEGDRMVGLTPTGRATIIALQVNRPSLVRARQAWVAVGWHPPND